MLKRCYLVVLSKVRIEVHLVLSNVTVPRSPEEDHFSDREVEEDEVGWQSGERRGGRGG